MHWKSGFPYRFTSSALWAIKKPWVFACILAPRGLMEILLSAPSSVALISIANNSSFNFVKHNLSEHDAIVGKEDETTKFRLLIDVNFKFSLSAWNNISDCIQKQKQWLAEISRKRKLRNKRKLWMKPNWWSLMHVGFRNTSSKCKAREKKKRLTEPD